MSCKHKLSKQKQKQKKPQQNNQTNTHKKSLKQMGTCVNKVLLSLVL